MTSLFSPFDDRIFSLSFYLFFFLFMAGWSKSIYTLSPINLMKGVSLGNMGSFFSSLNNSNFSKTFNFLVISLMMFIFIFNFYSIFPFVFPFTSHPKMVLTFSLSLWICIVMFSFHKNFKGQISHFIPEGAPTGLSLFLFVIEVVSSIIRPLTLCIRLFANILTGHILMILLASLVFNYSFCFPILFVLATLEMAVSAIQAYILATLLALYFSEL